MRVISKAGIDKTTEMPEAYDRTKPNKVEKDARYHVINSEGVTMHALNDLKALKVWRDHFAFGYYDDCDIVTYL